MIKRAADLNTLYQALQVALEKQRPGLKTFDIAGPKNIWQASFHPELKEIHVPNVGTPLERLTALSHEGGHATRFLNPKGEYAKFLPASMYSYKNVSTGQAISLLALTAMNNPSYFWPTLQAVAAVPMMYEEIMASKEAVSTLRRLGISLEDIKFARIDLLKGLASYLPILMMPLIGAAIVHKKKEQAVTTGAAPTPNTKLVPKPGINWVA